MILTIPETYASASVARDKSTVYADLIARLEAAGFTPTSWSDSDYKKAIVWLTADIREGDEQVRQQLFKSGLIDDAESPWLDMFAAGFFQVIRRAATTTTVRLRLTDLTNTPRAATSLPLTAVWNPTDPDNALYFQCPAGVIVPQNGFVDVDFKAERAGAKYNVPPGSITSLVTPIPGVGVSSPAIPGTASIVVVSGADEESADNLREACKNRWALLRRGWSARTIKALLRDFIPEATRVYVRDDVPLPGEAWVYMATATGNVPGNRIVETYNYFGGEDVKPLSNKKLRFFGATIEPIALDVTLYTDGTASSIALADQRLQTYMTDYDLGAAIYRERLEAVMNNPGLGVQSVEIANFPDEFIPTAGASVQFTTNITALPAKVLK
jgi:hypothetical protein